MILDQIKAYVRKEVRGKGLNPRHAAEEFFKLAWRSVNQPWPRSKVCRQNGAKMTKEAVAPIFTDYTDVASLGIRLLTRGAGLVAFVKRGQRDSRCGL